MWPLNLRIVSVPQLMKNHQIKLPLEEIKNDFHLQEDKQNRYDTPAWKQARDTLFTLRIYNRTLNKMERNSNENKTPQELKEESIKFITFNNLKEQYKHTLSQLEPLVDEELKNTFSSYINVNTTQETPMGMVDIDDLEHVNVEVKSYVLEKYNDLSGKERSEEHTSELQSRFDIVCR